MSDRPDSRIFVSAVTAWEYSDLRARGRLGETPSIDVLRDDMGFTILDLPAEVWEVAMTLPNIHRDPIDVMLIAHAISADFVLVTGDRHMHLYPVRTLW